MAYVGTPIEVGNQFSSLVGKRFSGDASTTAFTLDVRANSALDIEVFVENVRQDPNSAYTVDGTTLTFTAAPPSGTNNIYVIHQAPTVASVSPTAGSVTASSFDNSVISGHTALAATPADTDEFLVSDAGTIKRVDFSHIKGQGKIAQVVQTYKTDAFSTTSTSYVDVTGVSVAITPSATNSKILIQFTGTAAQSVAGWNLYTQLLRGSTVVGSGVGSSNSVFAGALFAGNAYVETLTGIYLDSPSTTSETTYKLQAKVGANTGYFGRRGDSSADVWPTSITAMEILG